MNETYRSAVKKDAALRESMEVLEAAQERPDHALLHGVDKNLTKKALADLDESLRGGRLQEALVQCQKLLTSHPHTPEVLFSCAQVLQRAGQHPYALNVIRAALATGEETQWLHDVAGVSCLALRDFPGAIAHFRTALGIQPGAARIMVHLGATLLEWGRVAEAEDTLRRVVRKAPELAEAHFLLGRVAESTKSSDEALAHYGDAIRRNPSHAEALRRAGDILSELGRFVDALVAYRQALDIRATDGALWARAGSTLHALGRVQEAEEHCRKAVALNPGDIDARVALGKARADRGFPEDAEECFKTALRMRPAYLPGRLALLTLMEQTGQEKAARSQVEELLVNIPGHPHLLNLKGRLSRTEEEVRDAVTRIEERLNSGLPMGKSFECMLHFTVAGLHDKMGNFEAAFRHFQIGNDYRKTLKPYSKARAEARFERQQSVFTAELLRNAPRAAISDDRMVFIVGMPRSGTSLVEQILASHPHVYGAGELWELELVLRRGIGEGRETPPYPHYLPGLDPEGLERLAQAYLTALPKAAGNAVRVTDKMPHNFEHVGMIPLLFPNARIIHCRRDPRDTCLSCYTQNFVEGNAYSYDLANCGHFYRQYHDLMKHWKQVLNYPFLELHYEDLVTAPEPTVKGLLDFCGLEWDDACLRFHENRRVVHTASYRQVKEPFHTRSVGRWRAYEPFLAPLLGELGDLAEKYPS